MTINVIIYSGNQAKIGADIALKNKLYVAGWMLTGRLQRIRRSETTAAVISIAYENDTPIAIALFSGTEMQVFCRASKRRQGIGSLCIDHIRSHIGETDVLVYRGVDGAEQFWESTKIKHHRKPS
jgi:hypothetical protein